jgi:disulfide bond formation protein DsbB
MRAERIAVLVGSGAAALIAGALLFQYAGGLPPCQMCHWQRWPHIAAAIVGIGGGLLLPRHARSASIIAILLVALSGAIGVFHAGVEWHWWQGPTECSAGPIDFNNLRSAVVRCDVAAWRLFGISLAGYNALISFGLAAIGASLLRKAN